MKILYFPNASIDPGMTTCDPSPTSLHISFHTDVEIGFVQIQYEVDRVHVSIPLKTDIKMSFGNLQRNVSLIVDLSSPMSTGRLQC